MDVSRTGVMWIAPRFLSVSCSGFDSAVSAQKGQAATIWGCCRGLVRGTLERMQLSIVVPACNEEQRIGQMLDAYAPFFEKRYGSGVELIVVVNGSRDGTADVVRSYGSRYRSIRLIVEPGRVGKGGALLIGFREAKGDLIGFADADGATPPASFQELVDAMGGNGCVIASRWRRDSKVSPPQPFVRQITSRVFNVFTRLLFGLWLTDTQCGAKVMRRDALLSVLPSLGVTRWAFDVDLLLHLKRAGWKIHEMPTEWHDVAGSKVEIARASAEMLAALVRLRLVYSPFRSLTGVYDKLVGPLVHPAALEEDKLFRHSLLVMAGSQVANLVNMLFQFSMAWVFSKEEYGVMATMLALVAMVSAPLGALAQGVSHFTAGFIKSGEGWRARHLAWRVGRDVSLLVAFVIAALLATGAFRGLVGFYQLESPVPLALAIGTVAVLAYTMIPTGVLTGSQAFLWTTGLSVVASVIRVFLGVALVAFGLGLVGALLGNGLAMLAAFLLGLYAMKQVVVDGPGRDAGVRGFYPYIGRFVLASAGYAFLMIGDLSIVKHYFNAGDAGLFAKAAVVARSVIFLPGPIATVLFPKVVSSGAVEPGQGRTLTKALILSAGLTFAGALGCTLFPGLLLKLLTGTTDPSAVGVLVGMAWALTPAAMAQVLMNFELAQRRFSSSWILPLCAAAYAGMASLQHGTLLQVVAAAAGAGLLALALLIASLPWRQFRSAG